MLSCLVIDGCSDKAGFLNAEALARAGGKVYHMGNANRVECIITDSQKGGISSKLANLPNPLKFHIVLLHQGNRSEWEALIKRGGESEYIWRYSRGTGSSQSGWLARAITQDRPLTDQEASQILTYATQMLTDKKERTILPPILGGMSEAYLLEFLAACQDFVWQLSPVTEGDGSEGFAAEISQRLAGNSGRRGHETEYRCIKTMYTRRAFQLNAKGRVTVPPFEDVLSDLASKSTDEAAYITALTQIRNVYLYGADLLGIMHPLLTWQSGEGLERMWPLINALGYEEGADTVFQCGCQDQWWQELAGDVSGVHKASQAGAITNADHRDISSSFLSENLNVITSGLRVFETFDEEKLPSEKDMAAYKEALQNIREALERIGAAYQQAIDYLGRA